MNSEKQNNGESLVQLELCKKSLIDTLYNISRFYFQASQGVREFADHDKSKVLGESMYIRLEDCIEGFSVKDGIYQPNTDLNFSSDFHLSKGYWRIKSPKKIESIVLKTKTPYSAIEKVECKSDGLYMMLPISDMKIPLVISLKPLY